MLEGLEALEFSYKGLDYILDYRIESEYFLKKFLLIEEILKSNQCEPFCNLFRYENGRPYSSDEFFLDSNREDGIRIAKIGDVTNRRDIMQWEKITDDEFNCQKGKLLREGDILMTLTGDPPDVGKVNYIKDITEKSTWNQRVSCIKSYSKEISTPEFAYTLLSTKYCRMQIERYAKGVRQRNLGNEGLERVLVPILSLNFQKPISEIVKESNLLHTRANDSFMDAEKLLLKELGFEDWQQSKDNISIKTLKDSFCSSGRIDAEYYQAFYEDCEKLLCCYKEGIKEFETICQTDETNYLPNPKKQYKYIELSNIGKYGNIVGCTECEGSELPTRARRMVKKGDVIVSSIEGSLDSCALITEDYDEALCSTGFYVVRSTFYNPETLLVLFKSKPFQMLMKKGCSGTILTAISKNEIDKIQLPLIDKSIQSRLSTFIQESFALRHESERLLEVAKKAVEIAISENEETALEYIQQNYHS